MTASDGLPVERSQSWCHSMRVPFFRFSAPMTQKVELDECRDVFIIQLMWDVEVSTKFCALQKSLIVFFLFIFRKYPDTIENCFSFQTMFRFFIFQ